MKAASAPLPEPIFYGAEWFECEQDAIDRLDQIKTRFVYRSHAIRPYDDIGRFLLEITFDSHFITW